MPSSPSRLRWLLRVAPIPAALALVMSMSSGALANVQIRVVSVDPYTNTSSFHKTEVEVDTYSFGNTIVADFQVGRFTDGGSSNIGWSTSTDGGRNWSRGFLPSTTIYANPPGTFKRATDPAVSFDAKHGVWLAHILLSNASSGFSGDQVAVSRSTDGGLTWSGPVAVKNASGFQNFDKTWIGCDNTPSSPNYGNCYSEWDDFGSGNVLHMSRSSDGGLTWAEGTIPGGSSVIGGVPLAQPNGTVVVPMDDGFESSGIAYVSSNGGASYTGPFTISSFSQHGVAGSLRAPDLLSADVDAAGRVYVAWYDCRFRSGCSSNDIVMSTSDNGQNWTSPVRIPIDLTSSTVDHFLPGIAVDPTTSGATAHLGVTYYFYPQANCSPSTCQLSVGFIESTDGGATWSTATQLAGPITNTWLPLSSQGYMVGDYQSTSFVAGTGRTVFAAAKAGTCQLGQITSCNETMVAPRRPLAATGPFTRAGSDRPVAGVRSQVVSTTLKSSR